MKNKRPIILNCFSRGGSNILWNILLSHLEVCSPIEETLQIFRFDWRAPRKAGLQATWFTRQSRFFDQWNLQERQKISPSAQTFIDGTLFEWKLKTLKDEEMRWKSHDALYSHPEVESSRLVMKNNNGIIFLGDQFLEMYPDAVFFALVRDPIPLYESHKRNQTPVSTSPEKFAAFYKAMVNRMHKDARRWKCCHILRFEDILHEPLQTIQKIYALAGLDISGVPQMRFKAKPHMQSDGSHSTQYQSGRHYWFTFDEIPHILEPEVNRYQVSKLDTIELDRIRILTGDIRSELGYNDT
jgi:hypothetical protein